MIGVLILAHDALPDSLVEAVTHVLGARPPQFEAFSVAASDDPLDEELYGFVVKCRDGKERTLILLSDDEGNGPGSFMFNEDA